MQPATAQNTQWQTVWERFCGLMMTAALAFSTFGALSFAKPEQIGGPMSGLSSGLFALMWVFGIAGILVCYLAGACYRKLLASLALGWSAMTLLLGYLAYRCPDDEFCLYNTDDHGWLLQVCLALIAFLIAYDWVKPRLPRRGQQALTVISRSMVVLWAGVLIFAVSRP